MESPKSFWDDKYSNNLTGWDLGKISPPIKSYLNQLTDKKMKILIPGAGRAHEAIYAFNIGFKDIHICDISSNAIKDFKDRNPSFPTNQIIEGDFFTLKMDRVFSEFDLIIEQTFYCAIDPNLRSHYLERVSHLLSEKGKLVGLLFGIEFDRQGPPFGGTLAEYKNEFSKFFNISVMEKCYNSVLPRKNNEIFINVQKI